MEGTEHPLTQSVSQLTGPTILSLSDDLLQTQRMTIEDLIEASERCFGTVLVRTCDIEAALGWYYQSCSICNTKVAIQNGSFFCVKCGEAQTAVPRYKVHLQVIDNSGSTTFTLFDRTVSQVGDGNNVEAECVELVADNDADGGASSANNQIQKLARVKIEKIN
ncbi:hypothetical protein TSUD_361070 [Trifolium subterraneum]|uniref:Replication factor A C-terminal domain-containing protein n=1 Tax=Trifolium subterraneum TaxID=3900 RepID=A0A2Z6NLC6_TRISU|nr:hypothetical protein TSUD_361070 [Trifolium subterraneum]